MWVFCRKEKAYDSQCLWDSIGGEKDSGKKKKELEFRFVNVFCQSRT